MTEVEATPEIPQVDDAPVEVISGDDTTAGQETDTEKEAPKEEVPKEEPTKQVTNGVKKEASKENVPPKRPGVAAGTARRW